MPQLLSVLLNNLPDNFLADTMAPSRARLYKRIATPFRKRRRMQGTTH